MKKQGTHRTIQHPLFGISVRNWLELVSKNGGIDINYLDRAAFITLGSIFTLPARTFFKMKYGETIKRYAIKHPPVIIIGHWRSGTTFLHELLAQDLQFCYVTLWNTMLPDSFPVLEPWKKFLAYFLPKTRPMDNIDVDIDGPYEEEAGIAVLSPWSFFHCLHFPRNADEQYLNSIHFKGLSDEERMKWTTDYARFMKTIVLMNDGKRLLLKDPANTARIPALLDLFPDAKFIHIYRNPYKVYASTVNMRIQVLKKLALQDGHRGDIERQVIANYQRLMQAFFKQQKLIPQKNFVEIRYEELVRNPKDQLAHIYDHLELPGFDEALPAISRYLNQKENYKTNIYTFDDAHVQRVTQEWSFTIDKWGYTPPHTQS